MNNKTIGIVGLGYVGLPLAIEFCKKFKVIGFDINKNRINELSNNIDKTNEISNKELFESKNVIFSCDDKDLEQVDIYIITVPTPIDKYKNPDISILLNATKIVAKHLKKNDLVIFESTVYPGCTEEDCVPVLEEFSKLKFNVDFFCGYSPERINPGDRVNRLPNIIKVVSGSSPEISNYIKLLYDEIIIAGTYLAPSIKVAEASKAIENAQRDLNISFVNELAIIFDKMDIDTNEVLDAASTKWNFIKFKPGLVGGHCIGVDPYYLAHKSISLGYEPQVILSGRKVNNNMGKFIAQSIIKLMINSDFKIKKSKALILGFAFKEDCSDYRNTRVIDIYDELNEYGLETSIFDPLVNEKEVKSKYGINLLKSVSDKYEVIIFAVPHKIILESNYHIKNSFSNKTIIYDVKSVLDKKISTYRL
ncbi:nucleotide sugar dehydrogenase [Flavobacteriaceae bacterium]|nr:nucleotide sugar dehydrogenase [Flavobacteriaceae bacterium]